MRYGVVSDIHANIQAWKAVLRDMKNQGVDVILCLGDVVGYGPNPAEVLDSCYEHVDYFILGNHDAVVGNRLDSSLFNDNAKYLIDWTKDQLNSAACDFFSDMPLRMEGDGFVCAHGELAMPGRFGYIYEAQDAIESFTSNQSPMMFVGHTHFPAKFVLDLSNNSVRKDTPTDSFLLPNERYLINAGSVGDPRDGNITASYCIYDTDSSMIKFRQVPFDIEKFRHSLNAVKLPVSPFFIRVYDGLQSETETIKDMKVMESNQTSEATGSSQKIIRVGEDVKTRRKKLNFSMDDVRNTRHLKAQEATRREAETEAKKKGKTVVIALLAALFVVFGIVIAVVKSGQKEDKPVTQLVNNVSDTVKKKVDTLIQEDGKDFVLPAARAELPVDSVLDKESGVLMGWTKQTTQLTWNVRVKNKGWYELFIEHAKKDSDSEIRLKMGGETFDFSLSASAEGLLEKKSLGYFETTLSGDMWVNLIALKAGPESVTGLKSISLKFHGDQKPNPFGDLDDLVFESFSQPYFNNEWIIKGDAFPHRPLSKDNISPHIPVGGVEGEFCAGSINDAFESKEDVVNAEGTMISRKFIIKHRYIHMLARGKGDGSTVISVSVKGNDVKTIRPPHNWPAKLIPVEVDVTDYLGQEARLVFRDKGGVNLVFDNIVFSNKPLNNYAAGSNELKKEVPRVIENTRNQNLASAGKAFIKGNIKAAVKALASGNNKNGTANIVDSSLFKSEILRFSKLSTASKKGISQLDSGNVSVGSCKDKDTISLNGEFASTQNLKYIQLDAIPDKGRTGLASNGNFFLTNFEFSVKRNSVLNKGRYVRISLSGAVPLSLAEVQVFSGDKNIAKGKIATQSSVSSAGSANLAVDGNTDGTYTNKSVTHTASNIKNPWWEVDLGQLEEITRIKVFNRTDNNLMSRLNRYSISIMDENRTVIWQDFIHEAKESHEHRVTETFKLNFDFAKASFSGKERSPQLCIHSKAQDSGWSVYPKQKEGHSAWFGLNSPVLINEKDKVIVKLFFQSNHKKHVLKKFRLKALSEDLEKLAEVESKFKSFLDFKDAVLDTFKEDIGKGKIEFIAKGGKKYNIDILAVKEDGKIFITKTRSITYDVMGEAELEKRALRMENGALVWAYYKGELAEKIKELEYDKDTFIGSLVEAGTTIFIAKYDPLVLSGRYIEIWRQENEKKPKFDVIIDSSGQKLSRTPKDVKFKDLYPDYPDAVNFDVSVVDLKVDRNISSFKIQKKSDGKVNKFTVVIKNDAKETVWQKSWYLKDIFEAGGMNFELRGASRQKTDINLAKAAKVIKGEVTGNWKGLTDGIIGTINPFAYSIDGKAPQEVILDLGELKNVNAFRAHKAVSSVFNGIQVEHSVDGENYTDLTAVGTENNSSDTILWTMEEKPVKFVKIKFINSYSTFKYHWLKDKCILAEFEVLKL